MSTNYYIHCDCGFTHHIGRSAFMMARFQFRGYDRLGITTIHKWKKWIKDKEIRDEYGRKFTFEEMLATIRECEIRDEMLFTEFC